MGAFESFWHSRGRSASGRHDTTNARIVKGCWHSFHWSAKWRRSRGAHRLARAMVRYELMRPDEVVQAREQASIAYVPIRPPEGHGPPLPLGLDGLHAHEVCARAAAST